MQTEEMLEPPQSRRQLAEHSCFFVAAACTKQTLIGRTLLIFIAGLVTCRTSLLAEEPGTNLAKSSFLMASSCRNLAVLYVSLRLCTKMSTWLVPASSRHCTTSKPRASAPLHDVAVQDVLSRGCVDSVVTQSSVVHELYMSGRCGK